MKNAAVLLLWAIIGLFVVAVIGFYFYVLIHYGNKPITEIPAWAYIFLRGCAK